MISSNRKFSTGDILVFLLTIFHHPTSTGFFLIPDTHFFFLFPTLKKLGGSLVWPQPINYAYEPRYFQIFCLEFIE